MPTGKAVIPSRLFQRRDANAFVDVNTYKRGMAAHMKDQTMTKPAKTKPAATAFDVAAYATTTSAYLTLSAKRDSAIDRADAALADTAKTWRIATAVALMNKAALPNGEIATIDSVQAYLIASVPLATRQKALKAGKIKDIETLPACGETVRSQFYALKTIVEAGHLDRLIAGEALNTIAREARKAKKTPAAPAPAAKTPIVTAPLPPVQLSNMAEMAKALKDYRKRATIKDKINNQADMARMIADLTGMVREIEAAAKAAKAKPAAVKRAA